MLQVWSYELFMYTSTMPQPEDRLFELMADEMGRFITYPVLFKTGCLLNISPGNFKFYVVENMDVIGSDCSSWCIIKYVP